MFPPLYAILNPDLTNEPIVSIGEKLAGAGVRLVQLREKHAAARKIYEDSRQLIECLTPRGVRVIVNDRPDIAAILGAGGVHVGQDDIPVEAARKICGSNTWVGVSTHNLAQLREADGTSADYIAVGPIFPTATKENPDPVVGIDFLRAARKLTRKTLVAIGGITVESAGEVFRAGADSVAVIRDIIAAADPAARAAEYLAIAERVVSARS
ncbi:MAG: thiamine phosphate synthase [Candidatus Acidiferrales bacterium]